MSSSHKLYGSACKKPMCRGKLANTRSFNEWWLKCDTCGSFVFLYEPMPHQERFHRDKARYKMFAGGFGSSKTTTAGAEFVTLALRTPNGRGLVGASTYPQLEQTSKKQVMDMLPEEFIEHYNKKDNIMTLTNGYEILFRSYDDEQKLRSLNLCHVLMEEANGTDFSIFTQLQTRLRHKATKEHKIILSTNPDSNWVRSEILMKARTIYGATDKYDRNPDDINPNISVHISRTDQNIHLPEGYIESIRAGKPEWWVNKFLYGSFNFSEGAVYPNFEQNIVEPEELTPEEVRHNVRTKGWQVYGGIDFGLVDPTVQLLLALDPVEGIVYVYDEYYKRQLPVPAHAKEMKQRLAHVPLGSLKKLMADPSGARRNINDRKSIFNHYAEYGLYFEKADNRIDAGILKVYSYLEMGKLKILRSMKNTIEEMRAYRYKETGMDELPSEKPADGEDHTCFIAGTLVDTERGLIPIEEVRVGDMALTRNGYKRVYDSAITGIDKEVFEVKFSNGASFAATGNHPVFVHGKGMVSVDSMRYGDRIEVSPTWRVLQWKQNSLCGTERTGESTLTNGTTSTTTYGYTGKSGDSITEKSLKDTTSTTKTKTLTTTKSKTLNLWKVQSILATTLKRTWNALKGKGRTQNTWIVSDHLLQNGTGLKKGLSGTRKTLKRLIQSVPMKPINVFNAELTSNQGILANQSSVATNASQRSEGQAESMMCNDLAKNAESYSPSISTQNVSIVVVSVTKLETRHDVYNISVEEDHEYYANGILVSNCDSLRYVIQSLPDDPNMLKNITYGISDMKHGGEEDHLPFELRSNEQELYAVDDYMYY